MSRRPRWPHGTRELSYAELIERQLTKPAEPRPNELTELEAAAEHFGYLDTDPLEVAR